MPHEALLGLVLVVAGISSIAIGGVRSGTRVTAQGAVATLLTALCIASYTLLDAVGVRHSGNVTGYVAWMFFLQAPFLLTALGL